MLSVAFAFNNSAADPFREMNLRQGICPHCESYAECKRGSDMPIISPVSSYVMKYGSDISAGITHYPVAGSWERQPVWFLRLLDVYRAKMAEMERQRMERESKKHGNSN